MLTVVSQDWTFQLSMWIRRFKTLFTCHPNTLKFKPSGIESFASLLKELTLHKQHIHIQQTWQVKYHQKSLMQLCMTIQMKVVEVEIQLFLLAPYCFLLEFLLTTFLSSVLPCSLLYAAC